MLAETRIQRILEVFGLKESQFLVSGTNYIDSSQGLGLSVVQISDRVIEKKRGLKGLMWFIGVGVVTPSFELGWGNPTGTWVEETYGPLSFTLSFVYGTGWMLEPLHNGVIKVHTWPAPTHLQIIFQYDNNSPSLILKAVRYVEMVISMEGSLYVDLSIIERELTLPSDVSLLELIRPRLIWVGFNSQSALVLFDLLDSLRLLGWLSNACLYVARPSFWVSKKECLFAVKEWVFSTHALLIEE